MLRAARFTVMPLGKYMVGMGNHTAGALLVWQKKGVCWLGWGWIIVEICQ